MLAFFEQRHAPPMPVPIRNIWKLWERGDEREACDVDERQHRCRTDQPRLESLGRLSQRKPIALESLTVNARSKRGDNRFR